MTQRSNGAYSCRAENRQGAASSNTINLNIKCQSSTDPAFCSALFCAMQTVRCALTGRCWRTRSRWTGPASPSWTATWTATRPSRRSLHCPAPVLYVLCCTGVLAVRPAGAPVPPRRPALHPHGRVQQTELQPRPPGAPLPPALDCTDTGQTEYGELLCYGVNSVGQQLEPCRFAMEPAGRVERCRPCYKVLAGKVARPAGLHCNNGWGQHRE